MDSLFEDTTQGYVQRTNALALMARTVDVTFEDARQLAAVVKKVCPFHERPEMRSPKTIELPWDDFKTVLGLKN